MDLAEFLTLTDGIQVMLQEALRDSVQRVASGNYSGEQASIDVHHAGQVIVREAFVDQALPCAVTNAYIDYLERAQQAGDGANDIATMYRAVAQRTAP
ncbi:MAG: hypothetical protein ACRYHA_28120 [Janthinobacterium lividum]